MWSGQLALATAAAFAGAAVVVNVAEQPARLLLDDRSMLVEWARSYKGAAPMQAGLAMASAILGFWTFWITRDWMWLIGAALILANWPYTFLVMMPVNGALHGQLEHAPSSQIRRLVERWGKLHMVRSALGCLSVIAYLWALLAA